MNKELLDYIQKLSKNDKKTLSQKALKVSEECGELAKVILPYDNAAGTTHRFIESEKILEESVDIILTAISMAYELGYSHDEVEEMMWAKAEKWHGIQTKEEKVDYPIPYEIHITIDLTDALNHEYYKKHNLGWEHAVIDFKEKCEVANVKPIILDLENDGETVMKDVMTSSKHFGNNTSAYEECNRIAKFFEVRNFKVLRKKIETVPWHPAAPVVKDDKMPKNCYFESHINCVIKEEEKQNLNIIAQLHDAHLSKNFFKKLENGKFVNMITYRKHNGTYNEFLQNIEHLKETLKNKNIHFEKIITEFSIYDTKVSHDFLWLTKNKNEQTEIHH